MFSSHCTQSVGETKRRGEILVQKFGNHPKTIKCNTYVIKRLCKYLFCSYANLAVDLTPCATSYVTHINISFFSNISKYTVIKFQIYPPTLLFGLNAYSAPQYQICHTHLQLVSLKKVTMVKFVIEILILYD